MAHMLRDTKKKMVEEWNKSYSVGQPVCVKKDNKTSFETETTSVAIMLGGHTPVVGVKGISGVYALDRVTAIDRKSISV